jgi:Zn-ribbon-containing, possibly nucleic-acid-binding protein (DUF2310)
MMSYELIFGHIEKRMRQEAEDVAESYIGVLIHNGQACGNYFTAVRESNLIAYINLQGIHAKLQKYHCEYGKDRLRKVTDFFGKPPVWKLVDDEAPKHDTTWEKPHFCIFSPM